ncbi:MAG: RES family NAD+ phosphorylase [Bacteroidota bacterium]
MEIFRISKTKYINDLTGYGAKQYGGRWNRPGLAALYTSEARSLAMLELFVHFASKEAFKQDYSFISLNLNSQFLVNMDSKLLPKNALEINDNRLWKITEHYFLNENVLALRVPSILIQKEYNIIINPMHEKINELVVNNVEKVNFDERFKNIL